MTDTDLHLFDDDWAQRMLDSEQHSLLRMLHDDLGQNLVAIKSFATAIADQHGATGNDTGELAGMIREAAESAYRSSYDLMQELRAQYLADRPIDDALGDCLEEARLQENGISYDYRVDTALADDLGVLTRAFVLRSVRCYANVCKALTDCERISVDLHRDADDADHELRLTLEHHARDNLDPAHYSLLSLADRLEAIGGKWSLETDDSRLEMRFDRLERGGENRS
jgi:glucose-6-phosphate-specific signal transduction histidine kinase